MTPSAPTGIYTPETSEADALSDLMSDVQTDLRARIEKFSDIYLYVNSEIDCGRDGKLKASGCVSLGDCPIVFFDDLGREDAKRTADYLGGLMYDRLFDVACALLTEVN